MSDTSRLRRGLKTLRIGLEAIVREYAAGDPLSPTDAEAVRALLAQHEADREVVRLGRPEAFAKLRGEYTAVDQLKAQVLTAMGAAKPPPIPPCAVPAELAGG